MSILKILSLHLQRLLGASCVLCLTTPETALPLCAACTADLPWWQGHKYQTRITSKKLAINTLWPTFSYQYPIDKMIMRFKHGHDMVMGKLLGNLLATSLQQHLSATPATWLLVPVPLHYKRLQERGFNQATLLAKTIQQQVANSLLISELIRREKFSKTQQGLSTRQRAKNVRKAFVVNQKKLGQLVAGNSLQDLRVLIVDDVATSMSTINAVAQCLQQYLGVTKQQIYAACIAKT